MSQASKVIHLAQARPEGVAAAAKGGYIRLFRSLQSAAFAGKPEYLSTWIHMLMLATHKCRRSMLGNRSIELLPGQFISGRKALANTVGVTEKQMRTILDFMVDEGMIARAGSRAGTVFTILNFEQYQDGQGQRSGALKASNNKGSSVSGIGQGPTQGQEGPTVLGQQKGQTPEESESTKHAGSSEMSGYTGANVRANTEAAKRATIQENNISTPTTAHAPEPVAEVVHGDQERSSLEVFDRVGGVSLDTQHQRPTTGLQSMQREAFAMHWNWQPGESFADRCRQAGIDLDSLSPQDVEAWVGEFRSYWSDRPDVQRQGRWEHKLVQQLRRCLASQAIKPPTLPGSQALPPSAPPATAADRRTHRAAITASIMDIGDTSW
ncbi:DnaT-like ssDNA-binding domain-containing protein [Marinobacterium weihaiense]|uniref:DnaT DNA-binding domain-containing protein n=1 Tax=Marinobacterium weihaiense TaxID=2851016 RepID=A0ABS6M9B9_9GAMM|nr:DnaT-like ssDNA-binding domain-containing protein [Marinobacterium weihaiense]MBV0932372.1 hypothetical protein [Marinobacterium weihaiense]